MTVGFHAPMPPARTGVADYASVLLRALREHGPVALNARDAGVHLYHLGNNQLHRFIYDRAIRQPGVAVLHDAVMQHFYLGALDESRYLDEYCFNYGEWEREYARGLYRERAGSAMDPRYFARPMLKRIASRSIAVIVHNPAAARLIQSHVPEAAVVEIPHFFHRPAAESPYDVRARLRIDPSAFLFGIFGHLRETKRIVPILNAFRRLHARHPRSALLLAGEFTSTDIERAAGTSRREEGVYRLPFLPDRDFWRVASAVDCCLNLRWPTSGETSGIGVRLMGLAKPVFFTGGLEISAVPPDACIRVTPGLEESAELFHYMELVLTLPRLAGEIGERARRHIDRFHSLSAVAGRFWDTLCAFRGSLPR